MTKGVNFDWELAMDLPRVNISMQPRVKAREVSFTRVMTSLVTEGSTRFTTWGSTMRRKVCGRL